MFDATKEVSVQDKAPIDTVEEKEQDEDQPSVEPVEADTFDEEPVYDDMYEDDDPQDDLRGTVSVPSSNSHKQLLYEYDCEKYHACWYDCDEDVDIPTHDIYTVCDIVCGLKTKCKVKFTGNLTNSDTSSDVPSFTKVQSSSKVSQDERPQSQSDPSTSRCENAARAIEIVLESIITWGPVAWAIRTLAMIVRLILAGMVVVYCVGFLLSMYVFTDDLPLPTPTPTIVAPVLVPAPRPAERPYRTVRYANLFTPDYSEYRLYEDGHLESTKTAIY